jgi:hypothetical protein
MPEVSRFYGITIQIYYGDHLPAHFHALYAGHAAKIAIETGEIIDGTLPKRALALVRDWVSLHQQELREAFDRAVALQPPGRIAPLE